MRPNMSTQQVLRLAKYNYCRNIFIVIHNINTVLVFYKTMWCVLTVVVDD